jgi:quinol monooxygenase YgiN
VSFIQLIEFQTSRIDEFESLVAEWLNKSEGWRTSTRSVRTRDRDNPNTYMQIVEFPSYEKAQENSNNPATAEFAARLAELCDAPPSFRNLDVLAEEQV